jgi:hypothetical protein
LLLKAALIQVSDYRLLGASGFFFPSKVTSKQVLIEIRGMIRAISDPNFDGR